MRRGTGGRADEPATGKKMIAPEAGSRRVARTPHRQRRVYLQRMYAIAIIRYRKPLDEVFAIVDQHRAYLTELKERGLLLASGPMDPRVGGALLLHVPDDDVHAALDKIRDEDPYTTFGMAQYELIPWNVGIGRADLDRLLAAAESEE